MVFCLSGWPVHIWSVNTSGTDLSLFFSVHLEPAHSEPLGMSETSPHPPSWQEASSHHKTFQFALVQALLLDPRGSCSLFRVKCEVFSKQSFPAVSSCFVCAVKCWAVDLLSVQPLLSRHRRPLCRERSAWAQFQGRPRNDSDGYILFQTEWDSLHILEKISGVHMGSRVPQGPKERDVPRHGRGVKALASPVTAPDAGCEWGTVLWSCGHDSAKESKGKKGILSFRELVVCVWYWWRKFFFLPTVWIAFVSLVTEHDSYQASGIHSIPGMGLCTQVS